jgi:hypothetical protein
MRSSKHVGSTRHTLWTCEVHGASRVGSDSRRSWSTRCLWLTSKLLGISRPRSACSKPSGNLPGLPTESAAPLLAQARPADAVHPAERHMPALSGPFLG